MVDLSTLTNEDKKKVLSLIRKINNLNKESKNISDKVTEMINNSNDLDELENQLKMI